MCYIFAQATQSGCIFGLISMKFLHNSVLKQFNRSAWRGRVVFTETTIIEGVVLDREEIAVEEVSVSEFMNELSSLGAVFDAQQDRKKQLTETLKQITDLLTDALARNGNVGQDIATLQRQLQNLSSGENAQQHSGKILDDLLKELQQQQSDKQTAKEDIEKQIALQQQKADEEAKKLEEQNKALEEKRRKKEEADARLKDQQSLVNQTTVDKNSSEKTLAEQKKHLNGLKDAAEKAKQESNDLGEKAAREHLSQQQREGELSQNRTTLAQLTEGGETIAERLQEALKDKEEWERQQNERAENQKNLDEQLEKLKKEQEFQEKLRQQLKTLQAQLDAEKESDYEKVFESTVRKFFVRKFTAVYAEYQEDPLSHRAKKDLDTRVNTATWMVCKELRREHEGRPFSPEYINICEEALRIYDEAVLLKRDAPTGVFKKKLRNRMFQDGLSAPKGNKLDFKDEVVGGANEDVRAFFTRNEYIFESAGDDGELYIGHPDIPKEQWAHVHRGIVSMHPIWEGGEVVGVMTVDGDGDTALRGQNGARIFVHGDGSGRNISEKSQTGGRFKHVRQGYQDSRSEPKQSTFENGKRKRVKYAEERYTKSVGTEEFVQKTNDAVKKAANAVNDIVKDEEPETTTEDSNVDTTTEAVQDDVTDVAKGEVTEDASSTPGPDVPKPTAQDDLKTYDSVVDGNDETRRLQNLAMGDASAEEAKNDEQRNDIAVNPITDPRVYYALKPNLSEFVDTKKYWTMLSIDGQRLFADENDTPITLEKSIPDLVKTLKIYSDDKAAILTKRADGLWYRNGEKRNVVGIAQNKQTKKLKLIYGNGKNTPDANSGDIGQGGSKDTSLVTVTQSASEHSTEIIPNPPQHFLDARVANSPDPLESKTLNVDLSSLIDAHGKRVVKIPAEFQQLDNVELVVNDNVSIVLDVGSDGYLYFQNYIPSDEPIRIVQQYQNGEYILTFGRDDNAVTSINIEHVYKAPDDILQFREFKGVTEIGEGKQITIDTEQFLSEQRPEFYMSQIPTHAEELTLKGFDKELVFKKNGMFWYTATSCLENDFDPSNQITMIHRDSMGGVYWHRAEEVLGISKLPFHTEISGRAKEEK